jgi:hypothetical protein
LNRDGKAPKQMLVLYCQRTTQTSSSVLYPCEELGME